METFSQRITNLTESEKALQAVIREIGKNEPTLEQSQRYEKAWIKASEELRAENPRLDLYAAGRILHQVCEQARNE